MTEDNSIIDGSPDMSCRNKCPVAKECGGCAYAGRQYFEQAQAKVRRVRTALPDKCELSEMNYCVKPFFYRNKVHSGIKRIRGGDIITGPYSQGSHRIVRAKSCLIENKKAAKIIRDCAEIAKKLNIQIYNEVTCTGDLRRILVRTADATGEIMVVLVQGSKYFNRKNKFIDELLRLHPEITTLLVNVNTRHDSMILGKDTRKVSGKGYITDKLLGNSYRISPTSFYQVNRDQAEILYSTAIRLAGFKGDEDVIDCYCGIGTTTLSFAGFVGHIIGVEINSEAVKDAKRNASMNNVSNADFVNDDAIKYMTELAASGGKCDCVILDPPRSGTSTEFIRACKVLAPDKIIYISCCPETLGRDLRRFESEGYFARTAEPVDMFPWTDSVECVTMLQRVDSPNWNAHE